MVMTLILIPFKLVEIPQNTDLWTIFAIQLYWNHTSVWVISSKFASLLQNTFAIWRAASGHLHYYKKHIYIEHIFLSIY